MALNRWFWIYCGTKINSTTNVCKINTQDAIKRQTCGWFLFIPDFRFMTLITCPVMWLHNDISARSHTHWDAYIFGPMLPIIHQPHVKYSRGWNERKQSGLFTPTLSCMMYTAHTFIALASVLFSPLSNHWFISQYCFHVYYVWLFSSCLFTWLSACWCIWLLLFFCCLLFFFFFYICLVTP